MRRLLILALVFLGTATACRPGASPPPTPFPAPTGTLTSTPSGPVVLALPELAAASGLYQDTLLQVSGLFHKLPLLVCDGDTYQLPATWALREEGVIIPVAGFDQQVRSLLPEDLSMTVEGRWRRWQGVVGCGKNAQPQEVWYLDVTRILSPSPIAQVTLTPTGGDTGTAIAEAPPSEVTEEFTEPPTPEELLPGPSPEFEATPSLPEPTFPPESYPDDEQTFATTPSAQVTEPPTEITSTLQFTPTATPSITVTGTVAATPPPGGGSATPSSTIIQGTSIPVFDQGDLLNLDEEIGAATLEAGQVHRWTIETYEDETFVIYGIAPAPADLIMSIYKGGQPIVNRQNTAGAGLPERLAPTTLTGPGTYDILVQTDGGTPTEYAIVANIDMDFPTIFNDFLTSGMPRNGLSLPENAVHYWFFTGNAGRNLTLRVTPIDQGDPVIDLYGPRAEYLQFMDDGGSGEAETLTLTLPGTGLYAIRVSEYRSEQTGYGIEITLQ